MNISVGITTQQGDVLKLFISTIDKELFPDKIQQLLGSIEIREVVL